MKAETLAIHAGYRPETTTRAVAVPIYQTVSYAFDNTQHGADLFDLKVPGNIYTRIMNPTQDVLEKRVAALEGGIAALALASGSTAITYAIQTIAEAGDNIVSAATLYGGTYNLFAHTLPQFGIEARFADAADPASFARLIDDKTKALYCESIGNPLGNVTDIGKLAEIAHAHGVPLIVDNTVPSPILCRPIEHGADIVVYSATKYLAGHGAVIGGAIVDGGKFDWCNGKFPCISEPDDSYHGLVFASMGNMAYINKARLCGIRDLGCCISPFNAWTIMLGMETLSLRMERHSSNAMKVAQFLEAHPRVAWVSYPGLESSATHKHAVKYFKDGQFSGIVGFGIVGGLAAGKSFINKLKLLSLLANIGDAKSLVIHPASTTHQQLSEEEQIASGCSPDFIRLSIGIEDIQDILDDLSQALEA